MPRPDEIIESAIKDGHLFVLEDVSAIRPIYAGISGFYPSFFDGNLYMEAGGSLISKFHRGYGLHKVLHYIRALTAHHKEQEISVYFGAIICPNEPSVRNILACEFEPWGDPPHELITQRAPYAGPGESIEYFQLNRAKLKIHAQHLLNIKQKGFYKKGPLDIQLFIDVKITNIFIEELHEIAVHGFNAPDI